MLPTRFFSIPALTALLLLCGCQPEPAGEVAEEHPVEAVEIPGDGSETLVLREAFTAPESAVHDAQQDVYFISNINGAPTATDDNGYITRVDAATGKIDARWIDGASTDITLHGPKGLSLDGDRLYAADVDALRWFDRRTGKALGEVAIPDPLFVNDVFAAADGSVYVSDSGMPGDREGAPPTPVDTVYRVHPDQRRVEKIAAHQSLNRPDGLWLHQGTLWITAFATDELYRLSDGRKDDVQRLPEGALDGLLWLADGSLLVSSWDANGIYHGRLGGPYRLVVADLTSPADFGYDQQRGLLIVPQLQKNVVSLHPFPPSRAETK